MEGDKTDKTSTFYTLPQFAYYNFIKLLLVSSNLIITCLKRTGNYQVIHVRHVSVITISNIIHFQISLFH